jgi:capsular polysaccharide biosynthesis protein
VPRVFVARKNTRAFTNENEMERFLSKFGFQKFYLEELAIEDQISLMAHAEYVVGAMGAAFGYLALNPSLKGVVEVSVPHSFDEFLAGVLSFKTDHYVTILPEFDLKKVLAPWECRMREKSSNFRVDLAFLEKSMEVFGLEPR